MKEQRFSNKSRHGIAGEDVQGDAVDYAEEGEEYFRQHGEQLRQASKGLGSADITIRDLEAAKENVGEAAQKRLEWALVFAQENLAKFTPGDYLDARLELHSFINPNFSRDDLPRNPFRPKEPISDLDPIRGGILLLPTVQEVREIQIHFQGFLATNVSPKIEQSSMPATMLIELSRNPHRRPKLTVVPTDNVGGAALRFAELLEQNSSELRRCSDPKCLKWFIGKKTKCIVPPPASVALPAKDLERLRPKSAAERKEDSHVAG